MSQFKDAVRTQSRIELQERFTHAARVNEDMSSAELARRFGVSNETAWKWLKEAGLSRPSKRKGEGLWA